MISYTFIKLTVGVLCTFGLYSILYRENKFYRTVEHIFLGLAGGWGAVALFAETLKATWYDKMTGKIVSEGNEAMPGYWAYALLLPLGIMAYFVVSKKNNWISRIPVGVILGLWAGQQLDAWITRYKPQIEDSLKPIVPTAWDSLTMPIAPSSASAADAARITQHAAENVFLSQAVNNIIFLITLLSVMSYFLFSFDIKNKMMVKTTVLGRWLLMVGFGAIFGSTVMTRFALLIDRMYFVWIEWFRDSLLRIFTGG
ncbi:MAG: hypothetical protein KF784_08620 [Fimbriimonadaceae bacterium]|nr:hypothetical protein [Fimbriimonadaceae bacterium]